VKEHFVDVVQLNEFRKLIVIGEPGCPRHPNGSAIKKIEMSVEEGFLLFDELVETLNTLRPRE
jgi:hypothetical protein